MMDTDAHWMHDSVVLCELLYHLVIMLYNVGTNITYSSENQEFDSLKVNVGCCFH